ncbi:MAG: general secretion pathway protein GspB [Pelovirga sp.]
MSFILDALKKSEHKRRARDEGEARAIFEPVGVKTSFSRYWIMLVVVLLLCAILLLGVLLWQRSWQDDSTLEQPAAATRQRTTATQPSVAVPLAPSSDVVRPAAQRQSEPDRLLKPVEEQPVGEQPDIAAAPQNSTPAVSAAEDRIYSISELPANVRGRLPTLQMALHAYNPADPAASLAQINGRLVRKGSPAGDNLTVAEITADGVILRADDYRFLLPRRGQ